MQKNTKRIAGVIFGVIALALVAGSIFAYQAKQKNEEEQALQAVIEQFSVSRQSFDGALNTGDQYQARIIFRTQLQGDRSKTDFELQLPMISSSEKVSGSLIATKQGSYLRLDSVENLLKDLPDNPLTNAIKANVSNLSKQYQGRWLFVEPQEGSLQPANCLEVLAIGSADIAQLRLAYKKFPFIENLVKTSQDGTEVYSFGVNEQFDKFVSEIARRSVECKASGASVTLSLKDDRLVRIEMNKNATQLVLSNFSGAPNDAQINLPQAKLKFSDLKKSTDQLFLP